MARQKRLENPYGFYEIKIPKNSEIQFFCDDGDFDKIRELIKKEKEKYKFEILSYIFLENKISFIVKEGNHKNISLYIGNILRIYSAYYKRKYQYHDKVFKKRYLCFHIKNEELLNRIICMHNIILKSGYDENEKRYSSISDYIYYEDLCDIKTVYSMLSKKAFVTMHYSLCEEKSTQELVKEYICDILKTVDYEDIKKVGRKERNKAVCELYYEKNISASVIGSVIGLSRQRIYAILKEQKEEKNSENT